ncbi:MAG: hypothetical protein KGH90_10775 [Xanthomonadaceae bacterium]|nr:hypothetical protein [Xanthomonadaceae bacterium]
MLLTVDLILFEPSRNVLYGMPLFIGTDAPLLRALLRGHGEWWDNPGMWLAGYFDDPVRIELRCIFNASGGKRYAKKLIPHLGTGWEMVSAPEKTEIRYAAGAEGGLSIPLTHTWFSHRRAMPQRVAAAHPGQLARQRGYWSPCDGAVALDVSGLDTDSPARIATLVERLMAEPSLIDVLRARAECCFLFHIAYSPSQACEPPAWLHICRKRETPLRGRHGRLIEADLLLDAGATPDGASR